MSAAQTDTPVDTAVAAIRAGDTAVLPTDTVYGLCATPDRADAVLRLYRLKGREQDQATALVAADFERLFERVPELRGRSEALARSLLPGPFTLILANPARRFPWLTGTRPETIGVRIPELAGVGRAVLDRVGAVAATSANRPGEPDPVTLGDVPIEIRAGCAAVVDGGQLPGIPSTVLDLTGPEPKVIREGAVPAAEALERVRAAP
jgi:L-threonylcarbamoyladenylate synthase